MWVVRVSSEMKLKVLALWGYNCCDILSVTYCISSNEISAFGSFQMIDSLPYSENRVLNSLNSYIIHSFHNLELSFRNGVRKMGHILSRPISSPPFPRIGFFFNCPNHDNQYSLDFSSGLTLTLFSPMLVLNIFLFSSLAFFVSPVQTSWQEMYQTCHKPWV